MVIVAVAASLRTRAYLRLSCFLSLFVHPSFCPSVRPSACCCSARILSSSLLACFLLSSHLGFVTRKFIFSFPRHCCRIAAPSHVLLWEYFSPTNAIARCRTYLPIFLSPLWSLTVAKMLSKLHRSTEMAFRHANCAISIPVRKGKVPVFPTDLQFLSRVSSCWVSNTYLVLLSLFNSSGFPQNFAPPISTMMLPYCCTPSLYFMHRANPLW